ncbi:MAG: hypothetical protein JXR37_11565 [Kiritimatiellae bacterium]|nr:hypothetical protein [Kiritimatiellia bacterium]
MDRITIGNLSVSRFIIGGNPFSGIAHQGAERDSEMAHYYTTARIKEAYRKAEEAGVNTHIGRSDRHIIHTLMEYWDEGGTIQWIAQTCPSEGTIAQGIEKALKGGASACFIHGGVMDHYHANNRLGEIPREIERIKAAGIAAGVAMHNPDVMVWAEANLDVDFYMCSYYRAGARRKDPAYHPGATEYFLPEDRAAMVRAIHSTARPVIHYKIMAAGRDEPKRAFEFVARNMRPIDATCVGIYTGDNPNMIEENVALLDKYRTEAAPAAAADHA